MTNATSLPIEPLEKPFDVTIADLPGSKSLTNRALLLAALAQGRSHLTHVLQSDDSERMLDGLTRLGFEVTFSSQGPDRLEVEVQGNAGRIPVSSAELSLGNAGTAVRFLTAACTLGPGPYRVDGTPRMRERPIGPLVELLERASADIRFLGQPGCPPLEVRGDEPGNATPPSGLSFHVTPTLSSQFISALLLIAPALPGGIEIKFDGAVLSLPYVQMTARLMERFGAEVEAEADWSGIRVGGSGYKAIDYAVEPDASNASYFLAAAAVTPSARCRIEGLGDSSLQGDVRFAEHLAAMGCRVRTGSDFVEVIGPAKLRGIDVNLNATPDLAQTLSVVALFAEGPTVIRDVGNLRVKETDRMAALEAELQKLGARVEVHGDDLTIEARQPGTLLPAEIETYDDHRMAMAFAVAGLRAPGVTILDPGCVAKTFPSYWKFLDRLRS